MRVSRWGKLIIMEIVERKGFICLKSKLLELGRKVQTVVEGSVLWKRQRWSYLALLYAYVLYRVFSYQYLGLMYIVGLYVIYLVVLYYTPSGLPDPDEDEAESTIFMEQSLSILRSTQGDRPVLRSINEFNLWKNLFLIAMGCWVCTYFDIFLVPVYWPFLLLYFLWLIALAVTKHWRHMKKYGYEVEDFNGKRQLF